MDSITAFTTLPAVDTLLPGELNTSSISVTSWRQEGSWHEDTDDDEVTWHEAYAVWLPDRDEAVQMVSLTGSPHRLYVAALGHAFEQYEYDEYTEKFTDEYDDDHTGGGKHTLLLHTEWELAFEKDPAGWSAEGPAMNYWYPLSRISGDEIQAALTLADLPLCVVEVDGQSGIALTGGGTDLTWEIVEAYIRFGMLPPTHFASLPAMAGAGESERDRHLIAACLRSFTVAAERAVWDRKLLAQRFGVDAGLTVDITREQLEAWAGKTLTDHQVQQLDDAIPNSSIPEAIATIVDNLEEPRP